MAELAPLTRHAPIEVAVALHNPDMAARFFHEAVSQPSPFSPERTAALAMDAAGLEHVDWIAERVSSADRGILLRGLREELERVQYDISQIGSVLSGSEFTARERQRAHEISQAIRRLGGVTVRRG
jgi:hypothetical protein